MKPAAIKHVAVLGATGLLGVGTGPARVAESGGPPSGSQAEEGAGVLEGGGALGRGVELGADAANGPIGLRGEEDRHEGRPEQHRAVREAQADGDGDDR